MGGVGDAPDAARYALVGPMGVGKSTVGRALAGRLRLPFLDADEELEDSSGVSVAEIFSRRGEEFFRSLESGVLRGLLNKSTGAVLATGGGVVLSSDNRRLLKSWGLVVYLRAPLEELLQRLSGEPARPLLQGVRPVQTLQEILARRAPLYQEIADLVVDCTDLSVPEIVGEICRLAFIPKA